MTARTAQSRVPIVWSLVVKRCACFTRLILLLSQEGSGDISQKPQHNPLVDSKPDINFQPPPMAWTLLQVGSYKTAPPSHPQAALTRESSLQKHTQDHHRLYFGGDWALPEVAILVSDGKVFLYGRETDSDFRQRERHFVPRGHRFVGFLFMSHSPCVYQSPLWPPVESYLASGAPLGPESRSVVRAEAPPTGGTRG